MKKIIDFITNTEPARVGSAVLSLTALLSTMSGFLTPEQGASVAAATVVVFEIVRSLVTPVHASELRELEAARVARLPAPDPSTVVVEGPWV